MPSRMQHNGQAAGQRKRLLSSIARSRVNGSLTMFALHGGWRRRSAGPFDPVWPFCVVRPVAKAVLAAILVFWSPPGLSLVSHAQGVSDLVLPRGHAETISVVALSPNDKQIATGSTDRTVILWDATNGLQLRTLECSHQVVTSLDFSADGTQLCAGLATGPVIVWDVATGRRIRTLSWHTRTVNSVSFSHDGSQLLTASGNGQSAVLWALDSGLKLHSFDMSAPIACAAFSPDGRMVATGGGKRVQAWKTRTNSRDERPDFVDSSDATSLVVWDAQSGRKHQTLAGHQAAINAAVFSADGKRLLKVAPKATRRLSFGICGRENNSRSSPRTKAS